MKTKKTIFIGHPIGGDVPGNMEKVLKICKEIHSENAIPVAPYLVSLRYLDDAKPEDRELGCDANLETLRRGYIDEMWLFGDRISSGMKQEVEVALSLGIPVIPKTEGTARDFEEFKK
ncbi:MAG: DUF4406 domain-containing protein [Candidatus Paceibacterota bacterium]